MSLLYFEDFPAGEVVEYGDTEVSGVRIKAFAEQFDPQPFHLDENAARDSVAGGLIASGWHTAAMLMRMNFDHFLNRSASQGAPGDRGSELAEAGAARRPTAGAAHDGRRPPVRLAARTRPG